MFITCTSRSPRAVGLVNSACGSGGHTCEIIVSKTPGSCHWHMIVGEDIFVTTRAEGKAQSHRSATRGLRYARARLALIKVAKVHVRRESRPSTLFMIARLLPRHHVHLLAGRCRWCAISHAHQRRPAQRDRKLREVIALLPPKTPSSDTRGNAASYAASPHR